MGHSLGPSRGRREGGAWVAEADIERHVQCASSCCKAEQSISPSRPHRNELCQGCLGKVSIACSSHLEIQELGQRAVKIPLWAGYQNLSSKTRVSSGKLKKGFSFQNTCVSAEFYVGEHPSIWPRPKRLGSAQCAQFEGRQSKTSGTKDNQGK